MDDLSFLRLEERISEDINQINKNFQLYNEILISLSMKVKLLDERIKQLESEEIIMKNIKLNDKQIIALLIAIETHFDVTSEDNNYTDIERDLEEIQSKLKNIERMKDKE